jgi:hypothetical protein
MSTSALGDVSTIIVPTHGLGGQAKRLGSGVRGHSRAAEVRSN